MNVSIIVPAYNVDLYLERCIASIFTQDLTNFEVIVINDGSKDNTLALAKELEQKYAPYLRVIDQENKGLSAVRNRGIGLAQGKYVIFLDSDDFYNPHCLENLVEKCVNLDLDVLEFNYQLNFDGNIKLTNSLKNNLVIFNKENFLEEVYFTPFAVNKIIKKELLLNAALKFVEGKLMEDDYFSTELYLNSSKIGQSELVVYNYFHNPKSIRKVRNKQHELKVIEDLIFSLNEHRRLYLKALNENLSEKALLNLSERSESIFFFMIIRMLKLGLNYSTISEYRTKVNVDKIVTFPNRYRGSNEKRLTYRILVSCINNDFLFKLLVRSKILSYL